MKWLKGCGIATLVIVVILIGAAVLVAVRSDRAPEPDAVATAPEAPAMSAPANAEAPVATATPEPDTVPAQQLLQDFRDNEIRGDQLHKDQVKTVTGLIHDIRDAGSGYDIDLGYEGDNWDFGQVHCQLREPEQAVALRTGAALRAWA